MKESVQTENADSRPVSLTAFRVAAMKDWLVPPSTERLLDKRANVPVSYCASTGKEKGC